ncbi:MAG TPA: tyrosine-type recombinase/integrase [Roseomonas sp.]|jgi:integrase
MGLAKPPATVSDQDAAKYARISDLIGRYTLGDLGPAWDLWNERHPGHSPGTARRYRALIPAAVNAYCRSRKAPAPTLPLVEGDEVERVVHLTDQERPALLRSYNPSAGCPALVCAYQGSRVRETLILDWRNVIWRQETIRLDWETTKGKKTRSVPMHRKVALMLWGVWCSRDKPSRGRVFLSSRGEPYADTRDVGGNPLSKAHATACARAEVTDFHFHDWACQMVLSGTDLISLMKIGGWSSLQMVQRYATMRADHHKEAISRLL